MSNDLNHIVLIGRIVKQPIIKALPSGSNDADFSIATNKKFNENERVSYFNCVAFGKLTDISTKYCEKGKQVAISGKLSQERWKDKATGDNKSTVKIIVENLQLLGSKGDSQAPQQEHPQQDDPNIPF